MLKDLTEKVIGKMKSTADTVRRRLQNYAWNPLPIPMSLSVDNDFREKGAPQIDKTRSVHNQGENNVAIHQK